MVSSELFFVQFQLCPRAAAKDRPISDAAYNWISNQYMESLFPEVQPKLPDGFSYVPDFIDRDEELALCEEIKKIPLHTFIFQGYQAKRKVASFGFDYSFQNRALAKGEAIPVAFNDLIQKTAAALGIPASAFAELLITEYPVGSVINWHRDAPPFDIIAGISLLSDCIFKLRPHEKTKQNRSNSISIPVQQRSLYIMKGIVRTDWQHSIAPVKQVRYSITLRTLRKGYPSQM